MQRKAGWTLAALFFLPGLLGAQAYKRIDVGISFAGVLSKDSNSYSRIVELKPTNSTEIFGSIRYHFTPKHAVEANFGHIGNAQFFVRPPDTFRVQTSVTEYTLAYVFSPVQIGHFDPFVLGGVGSLKFNPDNTYVDGFAANFGAVPRTQLAFLYGGGTDYRVWRVLNLRLQYRGLFYRAPDFGLSNLFTGSKGHLAEVAGGIVLKF